VRRGAMVAWGLHAWLKVTPSLKKAHHCSMHWAPLRVPIWSEIRSQSTLSRTWGEAGREAGRAFGVRPCGWEREKGRRTPRNPHTPAPIPPPV
jgi:hypothetical protein